MSRNTPIPHLDQARGDPKGFLYRDTAALYDQYQMREYNSNFEQRRKEWEAHYQQIRLATERFLWWYTERHKKRQDTTMALIGPGLDPAHRDFDSRLIQSAIARLRSIVVVDFSIQTNRGAVQSLIEAGVERDRLQYVLFDITQGLSTIYQRFIEEKLEHADNEDGMVRIAEELGNMDIVGELNERWVVTMQRLEQSRVEAQKNQQGVTRETREFIFSTLNPNHGLRFTSDGTPIPVDLFSLNMVLAGTGAAAEGKFWEHFSLTMQYTDDERGIPPDDALLAQRRSVYENIHRVITQYNTEVSQHAIKLILNANPEAQVMGLTDFDTRYHDEELHLGSLPRLDLGKMRADLLSEGIQVNIQTPISDWKWRDEPEHEHSVAAFTARKVTKGTSSTTPYSVTGETQPQLGEVGADSSQQTA